ncbi:alpha/beta fold hydrolase [Ferruginibacter sp. SUN106]|uniref:alpha/beta fold hydrolase n=1 Tax=Ferruginibacter sp. SUN106 TaxID=2978348 RepID=UPI003D36C11F
MLRKNISYQNATIFYRITGTGKPVVLVHGFGEDGDIWEKQIDFLKDYFTLIIPDLPGSGRSDLIADMSIEGMADVINEITRLELHPSSKISMVGHSMGGYIALAVAEKYPQLLNCLGLFHSSAFADSEDKKAARLKSIGFIESNGAYEFLRTAIPGLFFQGQDGFKPSAPYIDVLVEKSRNFTPEALIKYYQAMIARPDRTAILKNFLAPVLFIIGEHDQAVPFAQGLQQSYLPDLSYIYILRNSAHMGMLEEADKANAALLEFLQGQPE